MLRTAFFSLFILLLTNISNAQENSDSLTLSDNVSGPYFWIAGDDSGTDLLPLKKTTTRVAISGVVAQVSITQTYANHGDVPINGKYIFPGSTRAAVTGMRMTIGERVVVAQIQEKEIAKRIFEEAQQSGKNASLLQQQRPNVFSMDVANIMPGDSIDVELRYIELIEANAGIYEFVYPTVVGPRYSGGDSGSESGSDFDPGSSEAWVSNPYLAEGQPDLVNLDFELSIDTPMPLNNLQSISHKIQSQWHDENSATIKFDSSEGNPGNRDFILRYRLQGDDIISGLMRFEGVEDNYFLLLAEPPQRVRPEHIPNREYIFVVDVSGSMSGFPLDVSKEMLKELFTGLNPDDKFNILFFAGSSRLLAPESLPVNEANLDRALDMLTRQRGGGGTELRKAMDRAMSLPFTEGVSRSLVVLTDGYINTETAVFQSIREKLGAANIFAFGIGRSVNRYLIEGIARAGNGEIFIATDPNQAKQLVSDFIDYIEAPVLTDISISAHDLELYDTEPSLFSDMLAERPLLALGKYRVTGPSPSITVEGTSGSGDYIKRFEFSAADEASQHSALQWLWARKRIQNLSDAYWNKSEDNREEIVRLGLQYSLLTKYTSFVAVDEIIRNPQGESENVKQPLPLPDGVSNLAVGSSRRVSEPSLYWLLGLMLIVISIRKKLHHQFHYQFHHRLFRND